MLPHQITASVLATCLTIFMAINLYNLMKSSRSEEDGEFKAEVDQPTGLVLVLAALGTATFFLETMAYIFFIFLGLSGVMIHSPLQLRFIYDSWVQLIGIGLTVWGYTLFDWSVLARGAYATSWEMPENQKLVTWGPYKYVRHPSYLAYFLLFMGLFLTLINLAAMIPVIAIPAYVAVATREEEMLARRFGAIYTEYQHRTGKFLPKLKDSS
jgi:protein-S-isoprenylcysteine O-methyltransferase Ste14